jgi:hypothetical protein
MSYHLTDDEMLEIRRRGRTYRVRMRIWRGAGLPALVLIDADRGDALGTISTALADLIWAGYLGYTPEEWRYFEREGGRLYRVTFAGFGPRARLRHANPVSTPVDPRVLGVLAS